METKDKDLEAKWGSQEEVDNLLAWLKSGIRKTNEEILEACDILIGKALAVAHLKLVTDDFRGMNACLSAAQQAAGVVTQITNIQIAKSQNLSQKDETVIVKHVYHLNGRSGNIDTAQA